MSGMNSRNAIISVSNKEKVELLAGKLAEQGYTIYATKGTQSYLEKFSIITRSVEEISRTPEMFGGRVKTLSSFLLGGVLAEKRDDPEIMRNGITPIDLVYVELYPFREKFLAGEIDLVEDIDIGGVTLIRAAAKNHRRVIVIPGKNFIDLVLNNMRDGDIPEELRRKLAGAAFHLTSLYDYTISEWFGANDDTFMLGGEKFVDLRYGENPHQVAYSHHLYHPFFNIVKEGKEISYNNIMDAWSAWELALRLGIGSAVVVKHSSPCGAALGANSLEMAYNSDPVSAYGGVYAYNGKLGREDAAFLRDKYLEVIIAGSYDREALNILSKKKNLRILEGNEDVYRIPDVKTAGNIILSQEWNKRSGDIFEFVVGSPVNDLLESIRFGWEVIKSIKSNAILAVDGQKVISSSGGQPNRVDSVRFCLERAKNKGAISPTTVLISDGFFPFSDSIQLINDYGINTVAAPLGSIRDDEVLGYAREKGMRFVKVAERAFRH